MAPVAIHTSQMNHVTRSESTASTRLKITRSRQSLSQRHSSHEPLPFCPPYTNGDSELIAAPESLEDDEEFAPLDQESAIGASLQSHGPSEPFKTSTFKHDLADPREMMQSDEEVDSGGWVRKKVNKVNQALQRNPTSRNGAKPTWEESSAGLAKSLGYFRVNLSKLSSHTEYQVLAFTGGPLLDARERRARKDLDSTVVR